MKQSLLFVYNADSGRWNAYMDMAHKIFSPATYPCSLCDLTYSIFKIRPEWDEFVKNAPIPFIFLHKDEFYTQFPQLRTVPLPCVFRQKEQEVSVAIPAHELDKMESVEALKQQILFSF